MQSRKINQNITLSYIPMDKLKTTTVGFYLHRPLTKAEASKNALLASVLKQGSAEYPDMEAVSKKLDELYGSRLSAGVSKKGEDHIICFEAECISDRYVPEKGSLICEMIKLLCGVIFRPRVESGGFNAEIFERERKNLTDSIRAMVNDKRTYAHERLSEITCEGTAYAVSRLGDEASVAQIDRCSLYEYYKKIVNTSEIDIYVSGDADAEIVADAIKAGISGIEFTGGEIPKTDILKKTGEVKTVTEHMDVTQGKLAMSFVTGIAPSDEKYWGLVLANSIFGGGAHGKLFNNVREKLSLAYYAGSQLHKYKGFIAVNAGVEFSNFQKAYDEILLQLDELKKGNVTETEFTAAKMSIINSLNSYYDDQLYMQSFYLGEKVAGTNYDIKYYTGKIFETTVEEAVAAAQSIRLDSVYFLAGRE